MFDVDLDPAIYLRDRQFRLPGVPHATTGYRKIPIEWEWSDAEIGSAAAGGSTSARVRYATLSWTAAEEFDDDSTCIRERGWGAQRRLFTPDHTASFSRTVARLKERGYIERRACSRSVIPHSCCGSYDHHGSAGESPIHSSVPIR